MSEATSIHLKRAVGGDQASLGWIVAHFDPFLVAQVRLRLGSSVTDADEIRDVVDEIWLVTLGRIGDLRPRENRLGPVLVKFLATTSFNVCNNHLRKRIAQRVRGGPVQPRQPAAGTPTIARIAARQNGVLTQASWREVGAAIGAALDGIEPDKVEVLVLRLVEQRSNVEIAAMLGIPRNTVAVRYRRALERLRGALPPSLFGDLLSLRRA
jgi:RNA polymerase sigma factor (sigma-70 family)